MTPSNPDEDAAAYPPPAQAWWACVVLTLGCILAFLDRNIINLLVTPIQRDLSLTDTEISLLIGFAFGVFNAVFGLPVARWIDSGPRRTIAALGVGVWSLATSACGFAGSFWQLFAARVAVGAGEAAVTPAGVSLLADYFSPTRRGAAMGVFYAGAFIGGGGALLLGGVVWRLLGDRTFVVPVLGTLHTWQLILIGVGGLGLVIAPLTLTLREPRRLDGARAAAAGGVPLAEVVAYYRRHARTLAGHNFGFCLLNFAGHAGAAWIPTLLVRTLDWSIAQAGATVGVMMLVLGPAGSTTAGLLADLLARRGRTDGKLLVSMGSGAACAVACVFVALNPSPTVLLISLGCLAYFGTFKLPLAPGALQEIMPNAMRGQAVAVYVGVINIVAGGFAATLVALLTDFYFRDPLKLNQSFGLVGAVVSFLGVAILATTLRAYRATLAASRAT